MPVRYVEDMAASEWFWVALGLKVSERSRPGSWIELEGSGGVVALHQASSNFGECGLSIISDESLEVIAERLTAAGFNPTGPIDESWGRSMSVRDAEGMLIQINEHDPDLYT